MDPHHFNFHLNHAQAMQHHQPAPTASPPQSVPGTINNYISPCKSENNTIFEF